MNPEVMWIENDMKIELLASKIKYLRQEYSKKNPNASREQIEAYINRMLRKETDIILREQFDIISDTNLLKTEKYKY